MDFRHLFDNTYVLFIFKPYFICYKRNKLGICGFSLDIGHRIAKIALQHLDVAAIPRDLDGVPDRPLHARRRGVIALGDRRVQHLRDRVDDVHVVDRHDDRIP